MIYYHSCCGSAGIGRQARLRILWVYARVGSSPISRIKWTEPFFGQVYRKDGSVFCNPFGNKGLAVIDVLVSCKKSSKYRKVKIRDSTLLNRLCRTHLHQHASFVPHKRSGRYGWQAGCLYEWDALIQWRYSFIQRYMVLGAILYA